MTSMYGGGDLKGWQAVPIIIPAFLIISILTIWYYSFHHFTNRPGQQELSSSMNSSSRPSEISEATIHGPQNASHLIQIVDIPPLPANAHFNKRRVGGLIPGSALRAQRSKGSLSSTQCGGQSSGEIGRDKSHGSVRPNGYNTATLDRPQSYVTDSRTPPPIPAAHLHTPISQRIPIERPIPISPLQSLSSDKRRRPALHLNLDIESTSVSPLSRFTASRGSVNEHDIIMTADKSNVFTETPSVSALDLPGAAKPYTPSCQTNLFKEPKRIFVAKNPNSIFSSVKSVPNPAYVPEPVLDEYSCLKQGPILPTAGRLHSQTIAGTLRSFMHGQAPSIQTDPESLVPADSIHEDEQNGHPAISGPSLYTFSRHSPRWSITETDVYRKASPILHPLIEHPDLEKGFHRPSCWGKKTPDLLEAEALSREMRRLDALRRDMAAREWETKAKKKANGQGRMD